MADTRDAVLSVDWKSLPRRLKASLGDTLRNALYEAGETWDLLYLPLHFKSFSRFRYKYQARKPGYQKIKKRQTGQNIDLIYTGNLMNSLLRTPMITSTSKSVKVRLDASGATVRRPITSHAKKTFGQQIMIRQTYLNYRGENGQGPDKVAEIKQINPDEIKKISQGVGNYVKERIQQLKGK